MALTTTASDGKKVSKFATVSGGSTNHRSGTIFKPQFNTEVNSEATFTSVHTSF